MYFLEYVLFLLVGNSLIWLSSMNTLITKSSFYFTLVLLCLTHSAHAAKKVSPESVSGAQTISTDQAKQLFNQGVTFLDVRSNRDWEAGRIPGSKHLELKKVFNQEALLQVAEPGDKLVIYCNSIGCTRSSKACKKAVSWGYQNVYYYRLGFPDWQSNGYAVE